MNISTQSVIKDYQALRAAAKQQPAPRVTSQMTNPNLGIVSHRIDEDPATEDKIVAQTLWDSSFSFVPARLSFTERQVEGKQLLEFQAEKPRHFGSAQVDSSSALIDLANGALIAGSGTGQFVVTGPQAPAQVNPTVPAQPKPDRQEQAIRASYDELKSLVVDEKVGAKVFSEKIGHLVTLDRVEPGFIGVSYWGGAFSGPGSGTLTEIFRELREDGVNKLHYSKINSGDYQGIGRSEIHRTLSL